ncbi:MAG: enoyl-CoA hydratase/isomerase family protein [Burkholderiaceae bacterium]|nr:enoyl-CoA hydratase/isomerase family protein [Burkholderiaceae bacterium]
MSSIIYEQRGAGAWLTLNRPDALNALSFAMMHELGDALARARSDETVRVLVITGNGRAFCAGADLKEVAEMQAHARLGDPDFLDVVRRVFGELRAFPKPVIAAVNGLALAGGMELVMACDLVFAAESARLGDAHSNFGVFPGAGGAAVMPRRIGLNRAKYLLFSGEHLPAREMMEMGLVNRVTPDAELASTVGRFVEKLALKSPAVLRRMKEVANRSMDQSQEAALSDELLNLRDHSRSYDMQEGLAAFREKRKPAFKGY